MKFGGDIRYLYKDFLPAFWEAGRQVFLNLPFADFCSGFLSILTLGNASYYLRAASLEPTRWKSIQDLALSIINGAATVYCADGPMSCAKIMGGLSAMLISISAFQVFQAYLSRQPPRSRSIPFPFHQYVHFTRPPRAPVQQTKIHHKKTPKPFRNPPQISPTKKDEAPIPLEAFSLSLCTDATLRQAIADCGLNADTIDKSLKKIKCRIFEDKSFQKAVEEYVKTVIDLLKQHCSTCGQGHVFSSEVPFTRTLEKCKRCSKAFYCSQECRQRDWPLHKGICR
jgi:hypothetical protein